MGVRSRAFLPVLLASLLAFSSALTRSSAFSPVSTRIYVYIQSSSAPSTTRDSFISSERQVDFTAYVGEVVVITLLMANSLSVSVSPKADFTFVQGENLVKSSATSGTVEIPPGIMMHNGLTLSDLRNAGVVVISASYSGWYRMGELEDHFDSNGTAFTKD